jgi:hypothetical protein
LLIGTNLLRNAMRKNHSEDRFQKPTYRAQSGGKISQDFVNEILSDMRSQGQQKQPQVIQLLTHVSLFLKQIYPLFVIIILKFAS